MSNTFALLTLVKNGSVMFATVALSLFLASSCDLEDWELGDDEPCIPECTLGQECIQGECVNIDNNGGNNGDNNTPPPPGPSDGCVPQCAVNQTCVNRVCQTNALPQNPTECAPACGAGASCINGRCVADSSQTGNQLCFEVYLCLYDCADNDEACVDRCYFSGTATAQQQIAAMYDCLNETSCGQLPENQQEDCYYQACGSRLETCLSGTSSCSQIEECIYSCGAEDSACLNRCYYKGTIRAQDEHLDYETCYFQHCGDLDGDALEICIYEKCTSEYLYCFYGAGTSSCYAIYECVSNCETYECYTTCIERGTREAQITYVKMESCWESHCHHIQEEDAWNECIEQHCYDYTSQCID